MQKLYQFDNFVIRSTPAEICKIINGYYICGKLDVSEVFVDLDSLFTGHPQTQILYKLLCDYPGQVFAISNEKAAKQIGLNFAKPREDVIKEQDICPDVPTFNQDELFEASNILSSIITDNSYLRSPGRGSCCNCPYFYELGLTDINPEEFGLHPSRFFGYKKDKLDIDIDLCSSQIPKIVKEFNSNKKFKLIKKLMSNGSPHKSSHVLCSIDSLKNGNALFKRLKSNGQLYVSKSSLPIFDLLSLNILEDLKSTNWRDVVDVVTSKPLHKDVFQLGENGLAYKLWNSIDEKTIEDISFINASIRNGVKSQMKDIGEPFHISEVDEILKDTYNCLVYQDQINEILTRIFSIDMYRADYIRKNLNNEALKKIAKILKNSGNAVKDILRFCKVLNECKEGYLFCKGHSLSYAAVIISQLEFGTKI